MKLSAHQITLTSGKKMGWVEYSALETEVWNIISISRKASAMLTRGLNSCVSKGWMTEDYTKTPEGLAAWNEYANQA